MDREESNLSPEPEMILNVPYADKELAKRRGARWNPDQKVWYFPEGQGDRLGIPNHWLLSKQPEPVRDGYYSVESTNLDDPAWIIYKVQTSPETGRQYAKMLDLDTEKFNYVPGAIKVIAARGERLSLEKAKELGRLYGTCILCGRTLTNEESIEAGIGPICAGKEWL